MTIDKKQFRNCLGRFATGITVITAELDGQVHGMTANGFMSVSLVPPLVLVAVGHHTRMHIILSQSMRYAVSILAESQEQLSNHFAGRPDKNVEIPFIKMEGMSLIDGAIAHLVTKVVDVHEAGDHSLYIAEVTYLDYKDGQPLLYYKGSYRHLTD
jgi:flavin reductase (DIM6/NTAB) family NADH-FMN oxidoreductase RutF